MTGQELYERLGAMTEEERAAIVLCRLEDDYEKPSEATYHPTRQSGIVTIGASIILS